MSATISTNNSIELTSATFKNEMDLKEHSGESRVGEAESWAYRPRRKLQYVFVLWETLLQNSVLNNWTLEVKAPSLTEIFSNPNITFEEYAYYASLTRAEEKRITNSDPEVFKDSKFGLLSLKRFMDKKTSQTAAISSTGVLTVSDEEWLRVTRATRNATWGAVFFLITTDLFGPMSVPYDLRVFIIITLQSLIIYSWAISQLGYVPGSFIYVIFGVLAG